MSSTGQLNVRINLEKIDDSYHRWVGDERGYSNVDLTQIVDVYARTTSPAPVVGVEDYEEVRFDYDAHIGYKDQHSWSGDWNLGRTFHLRIPEVFRQGTRVDVEVGIKNYNYFWADDVSVNMSQILRYLVREVGLSSTGD